VKSPPIYLFWNPQNSTWLSICAPQTDWNIAGQVGHVIVKPASPPRRKIVELDRQLPSLFAQK
jgi:hypothetical protein